MIIAIHNLYGIKDGNKAYFRRNGKYCFDFVGKKEYASELTENERQMIMAYKDWYLYQFNASHMTIEK